MRASAERERRGERETRETESREIPRFFLVYVCVVCSVPPPVPLRHSTLPVSPPPLSDETSVHAGVNKNAVAHCHGQAARPWPMPRHRHELLNTVCVCALLLDGPCCVPLVDGHGPNSSDPSKVSAK